MGLFKRKSPPTAPHSARVLRLVAFAAVVAVLSGCELSPPPAGPAGSDEGIEQVKKKRAKVTNVVDGDTLHLSTGDRVRLIGLDTPEVGQCGAGQATAFLTRLVLHKRVLVDNPTEVENRDKYGRLLAYIGTSTVNDVGYQLIANGLAKPRYNSTDGYGRHPAEKIYAQAAKKAEPFTCARPKPKPPPPTARWTCFYAPTYDRDWHNDVLCSNSTDSHRPYLRSWDSFVTEPEIMASAREYEQQLNAG